MPFNIANPKYFLELGQVGLFLSENVELTHLRKKRKPLLCIFNALLCFCAPIHFAPSICLIVITHLHLADPDGERRRKQVYFCVCACMLVHVCACVCMCA